jgi:WD40 repeat protein
MVSCVTYSPDGKWIASSSSDEGVVVIWDAKSGREEARFQYRFRYNVNSICVSPNGHWLGVCTLDGVSLRDTKTWKEEAVLEDACFAAVFSPDSSLMATTDLKGMCLWDVRKHERIHRWEEAGGRDIAFSHDGTMLAASGPVSGMTRQDKTPILIFDVQTHKELFRLEGHGFDGMRRLQFSPNDKTLVSLGYGRDGMIRLWDLKTKKEMWAHETFSGDLAFTRDGKSLIEVGKTTFQDALTVRFRDVSDGLIQRQFPMPPLRISSICASPDEKTIVTASSDCTVRLWDRTTGKDVTPSPSAPLGVLSLAFSPNGKLLASQQGSHDVYLWDISSRKQRFHLVMKLADGQSPASGAEGRYNTRTVSFSPNGRLVASVASFGKCYVWDTATGNEVTIIESQDRLIHSVAFLTNDSILTASQPKDGITLWSIPDGKPLRQIPVAGKTWGLSADITPDGRIIAEASWGRPPVLHVGQSHRELGGIGREPVPGHTIVFSPDGKLVAVAGGAKQPVITVWDVASNKLLRQLEGHKGSVYNVAFSADGRFLVSAGQEDRTVRLWDVFTGRALGKCEGHQGAVYAAAISPDGKFLASGSADGTILLWDREKVAPRPAGKTLSAEQVKDYWSLIVKAQADKAYPAMAVLADDEKRTLEFLHGRLRPIASPDPKRIQELIGQLDADDPKLRDKAQQALAELEGTAEKPLRAALDQKPSPEAKRRLEMLLDELQQPSLSEPRLEASRAIQLLEVIGSPKAVELLQILAQGDRSATLTKEANSAFERIQRRSINPKPDRK